MRLSVLTAFATLGVQLAQAKLCQHPGELPKDRAFDFVVVGGGTAGSVIASRLSENPKFNVLLIEAGPNNEGVLELMVPAFYPGRMTGTYNWNFTTTPQRGLNNRALPFDRGYVLGGSSSINGMVYTRGAADDYDRWSKVTGDRGWSWKSLLPLMKRHEKFIPPLGGRNITGQYDPAVHGYNGNSLVSLPQSGPTEFDLRCMENTKVQKEFPFGLDPNSGSPIGLTWTQSTIGNGERSSAATAYLTTKIRERPNLTILINTYTTRVLPTGSRRKQLDFRTVEIAPKAGGERMTITAAKEVILSAGAFGSPQILLNSGIGDRQDLAAAGVETIHDLPDVGKDMSDHLVAASVWAANGTAPPPVDPAVALEEWQQTRTGPMTEAVGHQIFWSRIPSDATILKQFPDPSAGRNAPHIEVALFSAGTVVGGAIVLLTPHSRGAVKIRSNNPFDPPLIDPEWLSHSFDILALKEGAKITKRFFSGPAWEGYIFDHLTPDPDTAPDDVFEASLRNGVTTTLHPVGTAGMSAKGAEKGVLNPDLRVKGVRGLRVADAASIPFVPTGHTQAAVYILAERAADLIKGSW